MKLLISAPTSLTQSAHLEKALEQSGVQATEVLLPRNDRGPTDAWIRKWANSNGVDIIDYQGEEEALTLLSREPDSAIIAILCPGQSETLDLISNAESRRISIFIYRELYRQDPRVNCRFSPVERPDVWLRAPNEEHEEFFRDLHSLCRKFGVKIQTNLEAGGSALVSFEDGVSFEAVQVEPNLCRVRAHGSFRHRKIPIQ